MFSGLFSSVAFYIILALSASTAALGWLSLSLRDDKVVAVEALRVSQESVSTLENSLKLKDSSCKIDDASASELQAEKEKVDEAISPINNQLKELATVKRVPKKDTTNTAIIKQETTKDESNFLPDDGLLSPNVTKLLNEGWCAVYPDSQQCFSTRQSSGKSL